MLKASDRPDDYKKCAENLIVTDKEDDFKKYDDAAAYPWYKAGAAKYKYDNKKPEAADKPEVDPFIKMIWKSSKKVGFAKRVVMDEDKKKYYIGIAWYCEEGADVEAESKFKENIGKICIEDASKKFLNTCFNDIATKAHNEKRK